MAYAHAGLSSDIQAHEFETWPFLNPSSSFSIGREMRCTRRKRHDTVSIETRAGNVCVPSRTYIWIWRQSIVTENDALTSLALNGHLCESSPHRQWCREDGCTLDPMEQNRRARAGCMLRQACGKRREDHFSKE